MTPAALAAIEARVAAATREVEDTGTPSHPYWWLAWKTFQNSADPMLDEVLGFARQQRNDLTALLAHIRSLEAEREAEIAAAVAAERERCAGIAQNWRDGNPQAVALCSWTAGRIAAAIREPKP